MAIIDDHKILIQLDLAGIRADKNEKDVQAELNKYKVSITPKVNFEEINKLKSELKNMHGEHILKLNVDDSKVKESLTVISQDLAQSFSKAFASVGGKDTFGAVVQSAESLKKSMSEVINSVATVNKSLAQIEGASGKAAGTGLKNLSKRISELKDSLSSVGDTTSLSGMQKQAEGVASIVAQIAKSFENNPLRIPATFDVKKLLTDLRGSKIAIQEKLQGYGLEGIPFEIKPTVPKDYIVKLNGGLNEKTTVETIRAQVSTINAELASGAISIKVPVDRETILKQLKNIPIDLSFTGNFYEKLDSVKKDLTSLRTIAKGIKVDGVSQSATDKKNTKTDTVSSSSVTNTQQQQSILIGMEQVYKEITNLISTINSLKADGIRIEQQAAVKQETTTKAVRRTVKEFEKLVIVQNRIVRAGEALSRITYSKESERLNSKLGSSSVSVKKTTQKTVSENIGPSLKTIEKQQKEVDRLNASIQKMDNAYQGFEERIRRVSTTDYTKDLDKHSESVEKFKNQYSSLVAELSEQKGTRELNKDAVLSDLSNKVSDLKEIHSNVQKNHNELKQVNKQLISTAKNADKGSKMAEEMTQYMNMYGGELKKNTTLYNKFVSLQNKVVNGNIDMFAAKKQFADLRQEARKYGVEIDTIYGKLKRAFNARGRGLLASEGWMLISMSMRDVVRNVIELDAAMTELRKVTNATEAQYIQFLDNAKVRAKNLGVTLVDTVSATADMARLGYNIPDASNLANTSLIYLNVGDDVDNIEQASDSVISTMQGFNIEAEKSMEIVDKFNEVANKYASSAGDIGEITKRSAAAMKVAGGDINETIALGVTANEVVQDADVVGTAMKTMSMRLRASETDVENAGLDAEGMASSVSKLRNEIQALSGVDIMLDKDTFKTPYQMLMELGAVWHDLTDVSRANVGELLFGKRQANIGFAILENYERAQEILETSQGSSGSALRENEIYLQSIQGRMDKFQASWESLSATMLDSDFAKGSISSANALVDVLDFIIDKVGALPILLTAAGAAFVKFGKNVGKDYALLPQVA
ncbi:phage tail tape measure protein [Anaerovoracaceae bacterium 41-7]